MAERTHWDMRELAEAWIPKPGDCEYGVEPINEVVMAMDVLSLLEEVERLKASKEALADRLIECEELFRCKKCGSLKWEGSGDTVPGSHDCEDACYD